MFTPPDEDAIANSVPPEFLAPESLPANSLAGPRLTEDFNAGDLADYIADSILLNLPNDLTRMIYLASLRDCNSGLYLHPELSHQRGMAESDRAFRLCHERLFRRLLTTRLSEYVLQLQEYIRYTRSKTVTVLKAWKSLAGLSGDRAAGSAGRVHGTLLPESQYRAGNSQPANAGTAILSGRPPRYRSDRMAARH